MTFRTLSTILVLALAAAAARPDSLPNAQPAALRPPSETLPVVDHVLVRKAERRLLLWQAGTALRSYPVGLGLGPVGQKSARGTSARPKAPIASRGATPAATASSRSRCRTRTRRIWGARGPGTGTPGARS